MSRVKYVPPPPEIMERVRRARQAIISQEKRMIKCPFCRHNTITVFADSRGHVQTKCQKCSQIVTIDVVNMRWIKLS